MDRKKKCMFLFIYWLWFNLCQPVQVCNNEKKKKKKKIKGNIAEFLNSNNKLKYPIKSKHNRLTSSLCPIEWYESHKQQHF